MLLAAPRVSGALVVVSDLHVTGMLGEFEALALALTDRDGDGADNDLVQALIDSVADTDSGNGADSDSEQQDLAELRAAALVDARASTVEADGYRRWVLAAVRATAEARKESAFFGIGGERVSDAEREALDQIAVALGIAPPGE